MIICTSTYVRSLYPNIFANKNPDGSVNPADHSGLYGLAWKASRIGERLSPYVAGSCVLMALHLLFIKA
jgi:hypothetical protein